MKFTQLIKFFACAFVIAALSILTACSKDADPGVLLSKCDYSPYSNGSKFVFTNGTDTIIGDTSVNGVRYAKIRSTSVSTAGNPVTSSAFVRCDASGVYALIDKAQVGGSSVTDFTPVELQSLKLPAAVGVSWKSDTIRYTVTQNGIPVNVKILYKMQETAVGGSKLLNGTTYSNSLVTVQVRAFVISSFGGISIADSSTISSTIIDKTFGQIETTLNGTVNRSLKSAIIK